MNYGDSRSNRSYGCIVRIVIVIAGLVWLVSAIQGCMAQLDAEAKAKAIQEAMHEPTAAEERSEDIRDWMLDVGYEESDIVSSNPHSIVEGRFTRDGVTYCVRVNDSTPQPGDDEQITIWARNSANDNADEFIYTALAAPTPDTAIENYTSGEVASYQ